MKNIIFPLLILLVCACSVGEKITIEDQTYRVYRPPGTVKIVDQFYADVTELTNMDYKEFVFWMKTIYGENSTAYLEILPDTTVWNEVDLGENLKDKMLTSTYYQHPSYDRYPVVAISHKQAEIYTKWRTDRVAEMILLQKKAIQLNETQNKENYFTLEKYSSGKYEGTIVKENILLPKYKIPSKAEWELIAGDAKELSKKLNQNLGGKDLENSSGTYPARVFLPNEYGLYGIIGNVSEIIEDPSICKGGNWATAFEAVEDDLPFSKPNCYTGFRNVATLELVEVED